MPYVQVGHKQPITIHMYLHKKMNENLFTQVTIVAEFLIDKHMQTTVPPCDTQNKLGKGGKLDGTYFSYKSI